MTDTSLQDHIEQYQSEGYTFPIPVLNSEEVARTLNCLYQISERCRAPLKRLPYTHGYFPWAFELATHPALLEAVEPILGPDILVWGTLVLSKPADSRMIVSWHQDNAYAGFLNGSPAVSAWIALTPSTPESGCLRVIPRSPGRLFPFTDEQHPDDMLRRGLRTLADFDESSAVDLVLQPGEASLHEVSLIHGSNANRSDTPRIGFIVRYATPAVRQPDYAIYSVKGKPGNLRYATPPVERKDEECFAAYTDYLRLGE